MSHSSGNVICFSGDKSMECHSYPEAVEFYSQNPL